MDNFLSTIETVGRSVNNLQQLFSSNPAPEWQGFMKHIASGKLSGASGGSNRSAGHTVNLTMHIATPSADNFRKSQGQIMAEAASALQRAMRNL